MTDQTPSPEFLAALEAYLGLSDRTGTDSAAAVQAFDKLISVAPQELIDTLKDRAVKCGLMPEKPDGYTDDGTPVYRLDLAAKRLGITTEEAMESLESVAETDGPQTIDNVEVRRVQ